MNIKQLILGPSALLILLIVLVLQSLYHIFFSDLNSSALNAEVAKLAVFTILTGLVLSLIKHKTI